MATSGTSDMSPGTPAPEFELPDTRSGHRISLETLLGQPVLIAFICNHCPYVIHLLDELVILTDESAEHGVNSVAISANDPISHPSDSPERMKQLAESRNFQLPYCFDESQQVARDYGALCTPDFFLFDARHRLYYHGQFDSTRPGGKPAHGSDLRQAIDSLLKGLPAPDQPVPSIGCSIKWKR